MRYRRIPSVLWHRAMFGDSEYQGHVYFKHVGAATMLAAMLEDSDSREHLHEALRFHGAPYLGAVMGAISQQWAALCIDEDAYNSLPRNEDGEVPHGYYMIYTVPERPKPNPRGVDGKTAFTPVTMFDADECQRSLDRLREAA